MTHEIAEDLARLQTVLDRSFERAGDHLRSIFDSESFLRLSPAQLAERLTGVRHLAVATVNRRGEPRVSPVDGLFYRAAFHFSTPGSSYRLRHLRERPAISATHFQGDHHMVVLHGTAVLIGPGHEAFDGIDGYWTEVYGSSAMSLGADIAYVRIDPHAAFAFARNPDAPWPE